MIPDLVSNCVVLVSVRLPDVPGSPTDRYMVICEWRARVPFAVWLAVPQANGTWHGEHGSYCSDYDTAVRVFAERLYKHTRQD